MIISDSCSLQVLSMTIQKVFSCNSDSVKCNEALHIFSPFFSAMLLGGMLPIGRSLGTAGAGLAASCHSQLVRIACNCPSVQVQ